MFQSYNKGIFTKVTDCNVTELQRTGFPKALNKLQEAVNQVASREQHGCGKSVNHNRSNTSVASDIHQT